MRSRPHIRDRDCPVWRKYVMEKANEDRQREKKEQERKIDQKQTQRTERLFSEAEKENATVVQKSISEKERVMASKLSEMEATYNEKLEEMKKDIEESFCSAFTTLAKALSDSIIGHEANPELHKPATGLHKAIEVQYAKIGERIQQHYQEIKDEVGMIKEEIGKCKNMITQALSRSRGQSRETTQSATRPGPSDTRTGESRGHKQQHQGR